MNILLSAFAFAPNVGSEPGVGWRWATELGRQHKVIVVTDITRRALVEAEGVLIPENVHVVYFRPSWLRSVPLNSTTAQVLYILWQFGLYFFTRHLHRENSFDLAIHCTYSVFRHPSFLGYLGIPFIFGPVGGGEDAPLALKRSIRGREKIKELLRSIVNRLAMIDPLLWLAYARATLILVSTEQTRCALPWPYRQRAVVYPNLGVDPIPGAKPQERFAGEPLRILFAGRLLGWKGVHFALQAVADCVGKGIDVELSVLGKGPYESVLKQLAASLGIEQSVHWLDHRPQHELFAIYRSMHAFIFPSLHDSGGTVVLEAQANGLPVICLDLGGPATLVTSASAIVVPTRGEDEVGVVRGLTNALKGLAEDEKGRMAMALAAIAHARSNMSWASRVRGALMLVEKAQHAH